MAIITVSRELAALGDETARELAGQLGYRYVDKSILEERIKSYGVNSREFSKYDEKKPSFLASLSQDRDDYLHFLKSAVLAEAAPGNTVFIGRGAGLILKNVPGVVSVFLAALPEIRLERVKSYFHCDGKRALQIIEQSDKDREGFHGYFFDVKWKDIGNYHLALNTAYLHPAVCAEMVRCIRDRTFTEETGALGAKRIEELTLGQRVKHYILYEKEVSVHFLEASVSDNQIVLYGVANARSLVEAAGVFAGEIAPGYTVRTEIQVVHEYTVMP